MSKYSCEEDLLRDSEYLKSLLPGATHIIRVIIPDGEKFSDIDTTLDSKRIFNESQKYNYLAIGNWLSIGEGMPEVNNANKVGEQNGFEHNDNYRYFISDFSLNVENLVEVIKHLNIIFLDKNREVESISELNYDFMLPAYEIKLKKLI